MNPRYLPATRTEARSLCLGRLSVRTQDDRELGTLLGFVVDPGDSHICSLVMEVAGTAGSQQVELPIVSAERRCRGTRPADGRRRRTPDERFSA